MKKIAFSFLLFFSTVILLSLTGCSKNNQVIVKKSKIAISVDGTIPPTLYPGNTLDIKFILKHPAGIRESVVMIDGTEVEGSRRSYEEFTDSTSVSVSYKAMDSYAGNTVDIAISAEGVDGAIGHYDVPVFILATKPDITIDIPASAPSEFLVSEEVLKFDIEIISETTDMKSVTVYKNDVKEESMSYEFVGNLRKQTLKFSYKPTLADVGDAVVFKIAVMDVNGNIVESMYSVKFTKPQSLELNEHFGIMMSLHQSNVYGNFFDATNNIVYVANGVSQHCADIDWAWFYSANATTIGVALAAPIAQNTALTYSEANVTTYLGGQASDAVVNWGTRNETNFREISISAAEFNAVSTSAEVRNLYNTGTVPSNDHVVFRKTTDSMIAFKIARTSKYGLIHVVKVAGPNTGNVKFDYKIEK